MQCPSCCHVMVQCHEDKQILFCCRHQSNQTIKNGCIKNIKYIILKHCKQEHVHFQQLQISSSLITNNNDNDYNIIPNNSLNVVNAIDSISTISLRSKFNQQNSVHCQYHLLTWMQSIIYPNNTIILIVKQIICIFSQHII